MPHTVLECQVFKMSNSDACSRPTTQDSMLHPEYEYFGVRLVADPGVDMTGGVETVGWA